MKLMVYWRRIRVAFISQGEASLAFGFPVMVLEAFEGASGVCLGSFAT